MFQITSNSEGGSTITLIEDGQTYVASDDHPNYKIIVETVVAGDKAGPLFDATAKAYEKFDKVSTRVSLTGNQLYFDNDPVTGPLEDQILRFMQEDKDFAPLVKFYEKVANNPNEHSREQLFVWLQRGAFTIDTDGNIVMYKGVRVREDGVYTSIHSGPAIVNGVAVNGYVPQQVGDVVEMPRSKVNHDPSQGCSTGLHASNFGYARAFTTGAVLTVAVDPADVVSVPTECDAQKVRACRYTVTGVTEYEIPDSLYEYDDEEDWDDYEDDDFDNEVEDEQEEGDAVTETKPKVGDYVTTKHHAGYVQRVDDNPNTDKFYSVLLNTGAWVSLPK